MLATTEDSVTQIGLALGYGSASAFNVAFRDLIGRSPSAYRISFILGDHGGTDLE